MAQVIKVTAVGELSDERKDGTKIVGSNGQPRHWFGVEVAVEDGLADIKARRNFWAEDNLTLNRERALKAMASGANVGGSLEVVTVDIEPRPFEFVNSATGEVVSGMQRSITLIRLPGETLEQALRGTQRDAVLRGSRTTEVEEMEEEAAL